jgi:predicted SAM-dependent methyltransferase
MGTEELKLHIGGQQPLPGWKIFDAKPGPDVDYVGDCTDLGRFADGSVTEIYASHVLEHLAYADRLPRALAEFHRVLAAEGRLLVSVPDFEVLCRLFLDPRRSRRERFLLMRMAFGGQQDPHDFHCVGLTFEFLCEYLATAGFSEVVRVEEFDLFADSSAQRFDGTLISVNLIAFK